MSRMCFRVNPHSNALMPISIMGFFNRLLLNLLWKNIKVEHYDNGTLITNVITLKIPPAWQLIATYELTRYL